MQNNISDSAAQPAARREGVQALARAARLLRTLAQAPPGMTLAELALAVELPKSTVHRLVAALAQEDLLISRDGGQIALGPELARLGAAATRAMPAVLHPVLRELRDEVGETVDLSVPDGKDMRFIDQLPGSGRLTAVSAVGARFPTHCTANGKAFLAAASPERAAALTPSDLLPLTANTITSHDRLEAELRQARLDGVAYDREEHSEGICAVAAVIRDRQGPVATISVPAPALRFAEHQARYTEAVRSAAARASALLAGEL